MLACPANLDHTRISRWFIHASQLPLKENRTGNKSGTVFRELGGGGENRTREYRFCKPAPYHLATPPSGEDLISLPAPVNTPMPERLILAA